MAHRRFRLGPIALALVWAALGSSVAAAPALREVAAAWGVEVRHHHGGSGAFYMVETMGSGVAVLDYDGDGDRDLFLVDSGVLPGYEGERPRSRLLRNEGRGSDGNVRFRDVTDMAGIDISSYGMGVTAGDVDADGDLDLYITSFGANQLLRNEGDGRFVDVTDAAGVGDPSWSASAAFGDVDVDGALDLYVTNYVDFSFDNNPICGIKERGIRSYCHPDVYRGLADRLYRGRGDGTFEDISASAGIAPAGGDAASAADEALLGKGLGVVVSDLDGDGRADVYVANDMTPNFHSQNRGAAADRGVSFDEIAILSGTAVSDLGREEAGMGIGLGDADGNGHPDLFVTHLDLQTNAFYSNTGSGVFLDRRFISKLGEASLFKVGFGTAFADLDHDGDLDVVVANGHIIHNVELWGTGTTYKQANQLFENVGVGKAGVGNVGAGRFREVSDAGLDPVRSSRGLATGDLDGDGDLDLVITNSNDLAEVYENVTDGGGWLQLDLRRRDGEPFAIGASVEVRSTAGTALRQVHTGSSYLSHNDLTVHVGVGAAARVSAEVRWPDGRRSRYRNLPAKHRLRVGPPAG